jgi:hypothetical protein
LGNKFSFLENILAKKTPPKLTGTVKDPGLGGSVPMFEKSLPDPDENRPDP